MWDPKMLYYDCINEFFSVFFKDLLTTEHLGDQVHLNKMSFPDGSADDEANFWGYTMFKNDKRYLLSSITESGKEINIKDLLPIKIKSLEKVASKGVVYYHINKPVSAKFKEKKVLSFKETLDFFASLKHSNKPHHKLEWMFGLASILSRLNYRVATPPGFGKDSTVDILGHMTGKCFTIESPTYAKLEERSRVSKWLRINEIADIPPAEWKKIEQYLLACAAGKTHVVKHSRAMEKGKEVIDVSTLSLSLSYNDIDEYDDYDKYVDFVSKGAVLNRFPAVRLYGVLIEDFNNIDVKSFVKEHYEDYKDMLYNLTYWLNNYKKHLNGYDRSLLPLNKGREANNISRLLDIVDLYCDSQQEFNYWLKVIKEAMEDYECMKVFPHAVRQFYKLIKIIPQEKHKKFKSLKDCLNYLSVLAQNNQTNNPKIEFVIKYIKNILKMDTFKAKNTMLASFSYGELEKIDDIEVTW